jgi:hypothetical protein
MYKLFFKSIAGSLAALAPRRFGCDYPGFGARPSANVSDQDGMFASPGSEN